MSRRRPRRTPRSRQRARGPEARYGLPITAGDAADAAHSARWHWGVKPGQVIVWDDDDLPHRLIQIGNLVELRLASDGTSTWQKALTFRPERTHHLAFDPRPGRRGRLYLLVPSSSRRRLARYFEPENAKPLTVWAKAVGGKQGRIGGYPNVRVSPLAYVSDVTYQTMKLGDDCELVNGRVVGPGSRYIHQLGEEGGRRPLVCVSKDGRLWFAGGSYTCPTPGIAR